jgi:predicted nucleic acid-binding protein
MKLSYLIDNDWIIDHFNKVERVSEKLKELGPEGMGLSVISLAELNEGVYYSRDRLKSQMALDAFLEEFPVLGIDEEICKIFGREGPPQTTAKDYQRF